METSPSKEEAYSIFGNKTDINAMKSEDLTPKVSVNVAKWNDDEDRIDNTKFDSKLILPSEINTASVLECQHDKLKSTDIISNDSGENVEFAINKDSVSNAEFNFKAIPISCEEKLEGDLGISPISDMESRDLSSGDNTGCVKSSINENILSNTRNNLGKTPKTYYHLMTSLSDDENISDVEMNPSERVVYDNPSGKSTASTFEAANASKQNEGFKCGIKKSNTSTEFSFGTHGASTTATTTVTISPATSVSTTATNFAIGTQTSTTSTTIAPATSVSTTVTNFAIGIQTSTTTTISSAASASTYARFSFGSTTTTAGFTFGRPATTTTANIGSLNFGSPPTTTASKTFFSFGMTQSNTSFGYFRANATNNASTFGKPPVFNTSAESTGFTFRKLPATTASFASAFGIGTTTSTLSISQPVESTSSGFRCNFGTGFFSGFNTAAATSSVPDTTLRTAGFRVSSTSISLPTFSTTNAPQASTAPSFAITPKSSTTGFQIGTPTTFAGISLFSKPPGSSSENAGIKLPAFSASEFGSGTNNSNIAFSTNITSTAFSLGSIASTVSSSTSSLIDSRAPSINKILEDLKALLISGKCSDVTLNVGGKTFSVHKSILAVRAPFFLAVIEQETKENYAKVVEIDDCNPIAFPDFLCFLYTGSTNKLNAKKVFHVYAIADKYQVLELCDVCVNYMKNNITHQNFCDTLNFSLQYLELEVYDAAANFFIKNSLEIAETIKWSVFVRKNPGTANELFLKALKFYKNC